MARVEPFPSLFTSSRRYLNANRLPVFAKDETGVTEANLLLAQDHVVLKAPRIQAGAGPDFTCPPSHPQDSRVEYGEGGPLSQVTWRQNHWQIANSLPPVHSPWPRPPSEASLPGHQERHLNEFPAALLSQGLPAPALKYSRIRRPHPPQTMAWRNHQHRTLTEYEIIAFKTSTENAVDIRAIGINAKALKARVRAHIFMIPVLHEFLPEEQLSTTEQELRTVLGDLQSHDQAPPPALHNPQGPLWHSYSPGSRPGSSTFWL